MRVIPFIVLAAGLLGGLLSPAAATAQDVIKKTYCTYAYGYTDPDAVKADLLANAKRLAVNELFGELIAASTSVENLVVTGDQIRTSSVGFVRIDGDVQFFNGSDFGEVCVTIRAYATEDDRAKFEPIELNKRNCVTDSNMSARQLKQFAQEEAIVQALIDYDRRLEGVDRPALLQLLQQTQYPESGFLPDTETYCVRVSGTVVPIEVMAFLEAGGTSPISRKDEIGEQEADNEEHIPTYSESFRTDSEGWEEHSDDTWQATRESGHYRISITPDQTVVWSTGPIRAANFRAEVDVRRVAGPLDGAAGIVFGYQDSDNYALFSVSSEGFYRLARKVDGSWEKQIELTKAGAANTGRQAENRVGIMVDGDQITLFINETVVDTYKDLAIAAGDIGVVAETFDTGKFTVDFDNLDMWDLDTEGQ